MILKVYYKKILNAVLKIKILTQDNFYRNIFHIFVEFIFIVIIKMNVNTKNSKDLIVQNNYYNS